MAIAQQDAHIYAEVTRARAQAITRPATSAELAKYHHSYRTKDDCVRAAVKLFVKWHFEEEENCFEK